MKKIILQLIMLFVSAQCFAAEVVFDFSNPHSLKTTTGESISVPAGGSVVISNKSFVDKGIVLTFLANDGVSPSISNTVYEGHNYRLNFFSGNTMTFEANDGRTLKSIWCEAPNLGDWGLLDSDQPGSFKSGDPLHTWICDGKTVTKVVFGNSYVASRIWKIHVEYSDPLPIITPKSYSPKEAIESLTEFILTYSSPVKEKSGHDKILLTGETLENPVEMSIAIKDTVVTLTPSEPIKKEGSYTITVPKETFYNPSTGATNEQDTYSVTISHATFSCTFTPGENENLTFPITLVFPSQIGSFEEFGYRLFTVSDDENEQIAATLTATKSTADNTLLLLSLPENISLEPGNYRLRLAEKTVYNVGLKDPEEGRYNPEMVVNYVISVPVDELAALKAIAETLLAGHGVGYPADDDPARESLATAIAKTADTDEAKEALKTEIEIAIQALCNAEVILPETGAYKVCAINANNEKAWLSYNKKDGVVKLVNKDSQASPFALTKTDVGYEFKTSDGKYYLHVLATNTNDFVSPNNTLLVEDCAADNVFKNITIAKLTGVEGVDVTATYGKLSLTGAVNITSGLSLINSTAAVDFTTNPYSVVESPTTVLYFDETKSSGFGFEATEIVEEPETITSDLARVNIGLELKGSSEYLDIYNIPQPRVNNNQEEFELIFAEGIESVELSYPDHIYYTNEGNEIIGQATLRSVEGTTTYKVDVSVLNEGDFYFVIDEAALTVEIKDREEKVTNNKISLPFRIAGTTAEGSTEGLEKQTISASLTASVQSSGDPLTLTFTGYQNVVFANSTASYIANTEKVELRKADITGSGSIFTLNVVGLPAGDYYLVIPEGTLSCLPNDADEMVTNKLIELPFKILTNSTEPSDMTEFNVVNIPYSFLPSFVRGEKYVTSRFKEIYFFIEDYYTYGELYADVSKVLEIKLEYDGESAAPKASGHLVPATLPSEFIPNFTHNTYKLVYDVKPLPEKLNNGNYRLIVPVGTFGDINYAKYLGVVALQDGESKPKKSDCNVNLRIDWQFSIDETTGINNIFTDSSKVIYDLQGRRVTDTSKKGMYIINGKKVVVK